MCSKLKILLFTWCFYVGTGTHGGAARPVAECGIAPPSPPVHGAACPCGDGSAVHRSRSDLAIERSAATPLPSLVRPPPAASAPSSLSSFHSAPPRRCPLAIPPGRSPLHGPPPWLSPPRCGRWRRGSRARRGAQSGGRCSALP